MKKKLIFFESITIALFIFSIFAAHNHLQQLFTPPNTKAQATLDSSACSIIGNNTAFYFGQGNFAEAEYTLALLGGASGEEATANSIGSAGSKNVIIRLIGEPYGMDGRAFGQSIINISQKVSNQPFIVQASHNEYNCNEHPSKDGETAYREELEFTREVINTVRGAGLSNVTFITSQIDFYCGNWAEKGYRSPQDYITGLGNLPGIEGVSLPFYTGPELAASDQAVTLFQAAASLVNKPIYISESGPYRTGSNLPTEDEFRDYVQGVQKVLGLGLNIKALLLFNSLGLNSDAAFSYTQYFWDPACREAFRNSCNETDVVVETCFNGVGPDLCSQDPTIPIESCSHNCQLICDGTPQDPCSNTPTYDCSTPYDPRLYTVQEKQPDYRETLMAKYLVEYLERASISNGNVYELRGVIENADLCQDPANNPNVNPGDVPRILAECENATGQTSVDLIPSELEIAGIVPTEDANQNRQETHSGLYLNPEATAKEGRGALEKLLSEEDWWYAMSHLQKLKNACYYYTETPLPGYSPIQGHVAGYIDSELWGKVRCVNYVKLNCPNCSGAYANEKILFEQGIPECRDGFTRQCQLKLFEIQQQTPDVYQAIKRLRVAPSALMPIFLLTDELPGDLDEQPPSAGLTDNPQNLEEFNLIEKIARKVLNYRGASTNVNEVAHKTYYSSFGEVIGLDSETLALLANKSMLSLDLQNFQPDLNPPSEGFSNNKNAPFPWFHIQPPEDFFEKPRFRLLQKFANNYSSECMATWNEPVDRTTAESRGRLSPIRKIMDVIENGNLANQLDLFNTNNYDIQQYLRCAIFPKHSKWAQQYSQLSNQLLISNDDQLKVIGTRIRTALNVDQPDTQVPRDPLVTNTNFCKTCAQYDADDVCIECLESYPQVTQPHQVKVGNKTSDQGDGLRNTVENENSFEMPIFFPDSAGFLTSFFKDTVNQALQSHDSKYRCSDQDISYWECLTRRVDSAGSGSDGSDYSGDGSDLSDVDRPRIRTNDSNNPSDPACFLRDHIWSGGSLPMLAPAIQKAITDASNKFDIPTCALLAILSTEGSKNFTLSDQDAYHLSKPWTGAPENNMPDTSILTEKANCFDNGLDIWGPMQMTTSAFSRHSSASGRSNPHICNIYDAIHAAASFLVNERLPIYGYEPGSSWSIPRKLCAAGQTYYGSCHLDTPTCNNLGTNYCDFVRFKCSLDIPALSSPGCSTYWGTGGTVGN